jgi:hypothetical protein
MSNIEKEIETFEELLPGLLATEQGKYALIFKGKLLGTFTSKEDALKFGLAELGDQEFLIREITALAEPLNFFHGISVCR